MTNPLYAGCTLDCEREVDCVVCHKRKPPTGRDVSPYIAGDLCVPECPGHSIPPSAGHLWPGELARIREYEEEMNAPTEGR